MTLTARLTNPSILVRVLWAYLLYVVLVLAAFTVGYWLLPRGALTNTPWTAAGELAAQPDSPAGQFLATLGFNLAFVLLLGVGLNLQRVRGFPTGYVFIFAAAIVSGLIAGSNSFVSQVISPYTVEGWLVALRIQHLEMLGYTVIVASTIAVGLFDYSSWLPWRARETRIQRWSEVRLGQREVAGIALGLTLLVLAAYNETALGGG